MIEKLARILTVTAPVTAPALAILASTALTVGSAAAGTVIVLNKAEATASFLDEATGRVVATLPTGTGPHEVAVSPDGRTAVACNYGRRDPPGSTLTAVRR